MESHYEAECSRCGSLRGDFAAGQALDLLERLRHAGAILWQRNRVFMTSDKIYYVNLALMRA